MFRRGRQFLLRLLAWPTCALGKDKKWITVNTRSETGNPYCFRQHTSVLHQPCTFVENIRAQQYNLGEEKDNNHPRPKTPHTATNHLTTTDLLAPPAPARTDTFSGRSVRRQPTQPRGGRGAAGCQRAPTAPAGTPRWQPGSKHPDGN